LLLLLLFVFERVAFDMGAEICCKLGIDEFNECATDVVG